MMPKKKWVALLCLHIAYLFLGASIFYNIENPLETRKLIELKKQVIDVQGLIYRNYLPNNRVAQIDLLTKLSDICGEPMVANLTAEDDVTPIWDFYHAFFFSYTVISTIGYGNLAPTTSTGRIIMIFYALFGVPMNAILFANLGGYFASTFRKLYSRYKENNPTRDIDYSVSRFGLVGQISLYLIPGVIIFIFVPACLFVIFEGWDYTLAVYYAFVTLTTIGFGDYVAGEFPPIGLPETVQKSIQAETCIQHGAVQDNGFGIYFQFYKAFLIFWITFGLGYIGMCIGFLTQGLRSKKVRELEQKLAKNLKETHSRIWHGVSKDVGNLRKILNEISIMRYKPVYRDEVPAPKIHRSSSCPSFSIDKDGSLAFRRRANSEANTATISTDMVRTQSDSDLLAIDRTKTFESNAEVQPLELLSRVVDALGSISSEDTDDYSEEGIHGFSDSQILESERKGSGWSFKGSKLFSDSPALHRRRAASEIKAPVSLLDNKAYANGHGDWTGSTESDKFGNHVRKRGREKLSMPNVALPEIQLPHSRSNSLLSKLNPFKRKGSKPVDVESNRIVEAINDAISPEEYLRKTARGRYSMAPSSFNYLNSGDEMSPEEYLKKTSRGRYSVAPSSLQSRRLFSGSNEISPGDYLKKTSRGRLSVAPITQPRKFLSTTDEMTPEEYLKKTSRGRYSMAPVPSQIHKNVINTMDRRGRRLSTISTTNNPDVLEQTTIGDLIRAIEALHYKKEFDSPKRKVGTVTPPGASNPLISLLSPDSDHSRRLSDYSNNASRRSSITPSALPPAVSRRRLSLHPGIGNQGGQSLLDYGNRERRGSGVVVPPLYAQSDAMRRRAMGGAGRRGSTINPNLSPGTRKHLISSTITENIALTGRTEETSIPEIKIDKPT